VVDHDPGIAFAVSLLPAVLIGLANGIGIGIFRVHPLIMTLGTGLIGTGFLQVYQRTVIATGSAIPAGCRGWDRADLRHSERAHPVRAARRPDRLHAAQHRLRRLLYAVGDNEKAARLSGVVYWQVILALYVLSGCSPHRRLLYVGLIKSPSLSLAEPLLLPSVAAAVIGGTSIFGGRGGYTGTIVGALILGVLTTLLSLLQMPEGRAASSSA